MAVAASKFLKAPAPKMSLPAPVSRFLVRHPKLSRFIAHIPGVSRFMKLPAVATVAHIRPTYNTRARTAPRPKFGL
jgi:hypothetical protein